MRRTILMTSLLTTAFASLPLDALARCACWSMQIVGSTMEASFTPTYDASNFQGFVIDRSIPEFCGTVPEERVTPVPLAFGVMHVIELPVEEAGRSVRYAMKTVRLDGSEGSPGDLCEWESDCFGLNPPITYVPGTLGVFLGHGTLSGDLGAERFSFDSCTPGCGPACGVMVAGNPSMQEQLGVIAQTGATYLFWGSYDLESDYCFTQITYTAPAACTVGVENQSWGTMKGWFE